LAAFLTKSNLDAIALGNQYFYVYKLEKPPFSANLLDKNECLSMSRHEIAHIWFSCPAAASTTICGYHIDRQDNQIMSKDFIKRHHQYLAIIKGNVSILRGTKAYLCAKLKLENIR
jgi:hypothetical protein